MEEEIFGDPLLFGRDGTEGVVAVEKSGEEAVEVYFRGEPFRVESVPLQPVLWVGQNGPGVETLEGGLDLDGLVRAGDWKEFLAFQKNLKAAGIPFFTWNDPATQYLVQSGRTLFKGMDFADLRRLQLALEMDGEAGRLGVTGSGSGEREFVFDDPATDAEVFSALEEFLIEADPDVLEGHDLFREILPWLMARARKCRHKPAWGRNRGLMTSRSSRIQIAERTIQYDRFHVPGRHCVDTYFLAQFYDVSTRELDGFGLGEIAVHLEVAESDGGVLARARETGRVAAALGRSYFLQSRIFPLNYQDVVLRGNATKIDTLFLREYLARKHSIPLPPDPEPFEGGLTDIFRTGVLPNVWQCDASSLYPSIILAFGIQPRGDALDLFAGLLGHLRTFRLQAKAALREESDPAHRARLDALQNTFKILINSFYGYLGFAQGHFADFDAARDVTARGRQILGDMVDRLRARGAEIIEIDTDGIYFQPPSGETPASLQKDMAGVLPQGIDVEFGKTYRAMFSYKAKNYALLEESGRIVIKGGALKSRGMEPFLRTYLEELIRCLLEGRTGDAAALESQTLRKLQDRQIPVAALARTESLQDSPAAYQRKIAASSRNRSAAFEIALRSPRPLAAGDRVTYYITGDKKKVTAYEAAKPLSEYDPSSPDENIPYYCAKLSELAKKFSEFFEETLL